MNRAAAITARIAACKKRLLVGGMLRSVEWLRKTGPIDVRGRQDFSTTLIDALIQTRPVWTVDWPEPPTAPTIPC